jgi:hypothetical protein
VIRYRVAQVSGSWYVVVEGSGVVIRGPFPSQDEATAVADRLPT